MASNASTSIEVSSLLAKKPYLLEEITGKLDQNSLLSSSRTNRRFLYYAFQELVVLAFLFPKRFVISLRYQISSTRRIPTSF